MADVCDDDGVSGASLRREGAEKLFSFFMHSASLQICRNGVLPLFSISEIMLMILRIFSLICNFDIVSSIVTGSHTVRVTVPLLMSFACLGRSFDVFRITNEPLHAGLQSEQKTSLFNTPILPSGLRVPSGKSISETFSYGSRKIACLMDV
jgi:hypothetical protein